MATFEDVIPPPVSETNSGTVVPRNGIGTQHHHHPDNSTGGGGGSGSGSGSGDDDNGFGDDGYHCLHGGGGEDCSYDSSEQVLVEKLQETLLVGEEEEGRVKVEEEEEKTQKPEGSLGSEGGGKETEVGEKIEEEKGERKEDLENGKFFREIVEAKHQRYGVEEEYADESLRFPLRPGAENCSFYLKTGSCKFGLNCKFNHPLDRENQVDAGEGKDNELQGLSDSAGKILCKFYLTPGGCKYQDACRYSHSKEKIDMEQPPLNFLGLPLRPREKKCPFYLRNGSCGYGANCRFHHPDPTTTGEDSVGNDMPSKAVNPNDSSRFTSVSAPRQVMSNLSSSESIASHMPWMNPHQGVPRIPGWNQYQTSVSVPDKTVVDTWPTRAGTDSFLKTNSFGNHLDAPIREEFPERPGVPECDYFMKTGTCKFRSQCRYHHPQSRLSQNIRNGSSHSVTKEAGAFGYQHYQPPIALVEEYPERPGEPECSFFMKTGECKYKSLCRYHHPKSCLFKSTVPAMPGMNGFPSGLASSFPLDPKKTSLSYENNLNQRSKIPKNYQQLASADDFPERPGQPECDFFIKTGTCKYGSTCRYHHPKNGQKEAPSSAALICTYNDMGLPLRPGVRTCRNYEQLGICKYGPRCLFDHPDELGINAGADPDPDPDPEGEADCRIPESPPNDYAGSEVWSDGWA